MEKLLFTYSNARVTDDTIARNSDSLAQYREHIRNVVADGGYTEPECSVNLPSDDVILDAVLEKSSGVAGDLKYVVVVGIGGSNLGTKAVHDALWTPGSRRLPRMIFLDTVSDSNLKWALGILKTLSKNEYVICVVTKSGTTMETVVNTEGLVKILGDERVVRISSGEGDLKIPDLVGGRYSVLSAVGLFPLVLAGHDVEALRAGAQEMRDLCLLDNPAENPALVSAIIQFAHYERGIRIHNNFFFDPRMEQIGKWYRQLTGESLGKNGKGITPIVSIGSTDLHSMAQLYVAGPRDKFTTFIAVEGDNGKLDTVMRAIYGGTRSTYIKNELPFAEVRLPQLDEYTVGAFLQFRMVEMMYLAKLLDVNAFDQPNVEQFKEATRKLLK